MRIADWSRQRLCCRASLQTQAAGTRVICAPFGRQLGSSMQVPSEAPSTHFYCTVRPRSMESVLPQAPRTVGVKIPRCGTRLLADTLLSGKGYSRWCASVLKAELRFGRSLETGGWSHSSHHEHARPLPCKYVSIIIASTLSVRPVLKDFI